MGACSTCDVGSAVVLLLMFYMSRATAAHVAGSAPQQLSKAVVRHSCHRARAPRCLHRPYSWNELNLHAANQSARYEAGEYPGRSPDGNAMYDLYKQWCVEQGRGMSNSEYVLRYVAWHSGSALEPSLAPYLLEGGIEHWILWHYSQDDVPGDTELEPSSEVQLAMDHLSRSGAHVERSVIIAFQNVLPLRSIPTIAHSHVFLHVECMPHEAQMAVAEMRIAWRRRSPWLQVQQRRRTGIDGAFRQSGG